MNQTRPATAGVLLVLLGAVCAHAQTPIGDIQVYNPATGDPISPYLGQTVAIEGVVTVPPGVFHDQILYIQDATGGIMIFDPAPPAVSLGDRVQVVGPVSDYEGELRVDASLWANIEPDAEVAPVDLTAAEVATDHENIGVLARLDGTVLSLLDNTFELTDGTGAASILVPPASGIDYSAIDPGDTYAVIGPVTRRFGDIRMKPRFQADLIDVSSMDPGPVILSYDNSNWAPRDEDGWEMTFMVEEDGVLGGATFRYRIVEDGPEWNEILWTPEKHALGVYPVSFAGASSGKPSKIEWTFEAVDDASNAVAIPLQTFAAGTWRMADIQQVDPCDPDQSSPLAGEPVNFEAVVCAVEDDRLALVDSWGVLDKGVYPVSFAGASSGKPSRIEWIMPGDQVRIGGRVAEVDGLTTITPYMESAIMLLSFGNDLPEPPRVHTAVLADDTFDDGDCIKGEAYESMWVRPWLAQVTGTDDFESDGTYWISSTGRAEDALVVRQRSGLAYAPNVGDVVDITGYMTYTGDRFELIPTDDRFVFLSAVTGVVDDVPSDRAAGFVGIAPNPFNPATEIRFRLAQDDLAQLNIYDLHGKLVAQLANERLNGGIDHVRRWDGTDRQGNGVGSGVYFARLRIGTSMHEVRQLTLVK